MARGDQLARQWTLVRLLSGRTRTDAGATSGGAWSRQANGATGHRGARRRGFPGCLGIAQRDGVLALHGRVSRRSACVPDSGGADRRSISARASLSLCKARRFTNRLNPLYRKSPPRCRLKVFNSFEALTTLSRCGHSGSRITAGQRASSTLLHALCCTDLRRGSITGLPDLRSALNVMLIRTACGT